MYAANPPKSWNLALSPISESPDGDVAPFYMVSSLGGNAGAGGFNAGGFNDTTLNGLVQLEENTTGGPQRLAVFQKIDGYIHEQLPVLEIYYELQIVAWSTQFQGFELGLGNPWHDYFGSLKMQSLDNVSMVSSTTYQQPYLLRYIFQLLDSTETSSFSTSVDRFQHFDRHQSYGRFTSSTPATSSSTSSSSSSSSSNTLFIAGAIVIVIIIIAAVAALMMRRGKSSGSAPTTPDNHNNLIS